MKKPLVVLDYNLYEITEQYFKGVIIYKNQEIIKEIKLYEYVGYMCMDGILVLIGHDSDIVMINLQTLEIKKERFR